ncbi:FixH family protein [Pedobacter jamesrossensis]|uniref:FixH family protein n=2 Tax=Pedobacter jamesrossensis TaxID=1908238 RepID=A0ABV8NM94_9SPHI
MAIFILFILGLGFYMLSKQGNDTLVESNYYEKGLTYDEEYNALENTFAEHAEPIITVNPNQLILQLKDSANYSLVLMRPSNAKADKKFAGKTIGKNHLILLQRNVTDKGLWLLDLKWESNNKNYQYKKSITL